MPRSLDSLTPRHLPTASLWLNFLIPTSSPRIGYELWWLLWFLNLGSCLVQRCMKIALCDKILSTFFLLLFSRAFSSPFATYFYVASATRLEMTHVSREFPHRSNPSLFPTRFLAFSEIEGGFRSARSDQIDRFEAPPALVKKQKKKKSRLREALERGSPRQFSAREGVRKRKLLRRFLKETCADNTRMNKTPFPLKNEE
jgi:hypothetical protein